MKIAPHFHEGHVAYLVGRADTIANDAGLFKGLDQAQLERSGKIRKLRSSTELLKKIKRESLTPTRTIMKYLGS